MSLQDLLLGNQYLAQQAALAAAAAAASNRSNNNNNINNNINNNNNNNNHNNSPSSNSNNNNNAHQLNNQLLLNAIETADQLQLHQHQQATGAHQHQHHQQHHQQLSSSNNTANQQQQQQIYPTNMKLSNSQVQWSQYQQALASALMSIGGCDSGTSAGSYTTTTNDSSGLSNLGEFELSLAQSKNSSPSPPLPPTPTPTQPLLTTTTNMNKDTVKQLNDLQLRQQQQNLLALLMNLTNNAVSLTSNLGTNSSPMNPNDQQAKYSPPQDHHQQQQQQHIHTRISNAASICNQQFHQQQLLAAIMQQHQQQLQNHQHEINDAITFNTKANHTINPSISPNFQPTNKLSSYSSTLGVSHNNKGSSNSSRFNPMRSSQHPQSQPPINSKLKTNLTTNNHSSCTTNSTTTTSTLTTTTNRPPSKCSTAITSSPPPPPPPSSVSVVQSTPINSTAYWRLLESLFDMNDEPEDDAIELIAQRINSSTADVANWFQTRREAERTLCNTAFPSTPTIINENLKTVPSSTLLAKLNSVTSRPNSHILATHLDQKMIDLLEAFYAINDNPEPAAIEMIAKRINTTVEAIGDWFDEKRIKTNPHAGPRSPPAKKREGGRVVTFSEYQRSLLEAIFDENNYLHPQEYEELSNLIQVPSRNIKIWFKNRRSKQRLSGRTTTPGSVNNSD